MAVARRLPRFGDAAARELLLQRHRLKDLLVLRIDEFLARGWCVEALESFPGKFVPIFHNLVASWTYRQQGSAFMLCSTRLRIPGFW